jgi:hypothetical protein
VRRFSAVGVLAAAIAAVVACGDDDAPTIVYVVPEGGSPAPVDNGTTCEPANVPAPPFNPSPLNQGKCTDEQIKQLLDACTFNGSAEACAAARMQLGDCAACMIGAESDPTIHPLYQLDPNAGAVISEGACMVALAPNDTAKACGIAFGQLEVCTYAACVTPCFNDDNDDHFNACIQDAVGTACMAGIDTFQSCGPSYDDATFGYCTSGKNADGSDMTNLQYWTAIAKAYCGAPGTSPIDAGITDAADQ